MRLFNKTTVVLVHVQVMLLNNWPRLSSPSERGGGGGGGGGCVSGVGVAHEQRPPQGSLHCCVHKDRLVRTNEAT